MSPTAASTIASYYEPIIGANGTTWPEAGHGLLGELASSRDRYALIAAKPSAADRLVDRLAADLDLRVVHLGAALASRGGPPTLADVEAECATATVLTDLDVLLWPELGVPVLPVLIALARRRSTIAVWPGEIIGHRARYSSAGRPDHYDARLTDVIVLRPRTTRFPDEVPYQIERITP